MARQVLIVGGAGFIGSHLTDELLQTGYKVRVLDNLCTQVHGPGCKRPEYLSRDAELIIGDVCCLETVKAALKNVDDVYHLAAMVGVGQSMYAIRDYTEVNDVGTATLLQALVEKPVQRLIVASSMSVYGEGLYRDMDGKPAFPQNRLLRDLEKGEWELSDHFGRYLTPIYTPESKPPHLASVYALSKYSQEQMSLIVGKAYKIPVVALRFFNVYGTRQALSNPYTGVLAIFASRILNNRSPLIYEDGLQQRDFVHVSDVARACRLALEVSSAAGQVFNIGSGNRYTILEIGYRLAEILGKEHLIPEITGHFRFGDIRHCFADISLATRLLGYEARVRLEDGLTELAEWVAGQTAVDRCEQAGYELQCRGLIHQTALLRAPRLERIRIR